MEYDIYYSPVKFEVLRSSDGGAIPEMVVVVGLPGMINFARVPVLSAGDCSSPFCGAEYPTIRDEP
jgi:hypothetical protein